MPIVYDCDKEINGMFDPYCGPITLKDKWIVFELADGQPGLDVINLKRMACMDSWRASLKMKLEP